VSAEVELWMLEGSEVQTVGAEMLKLQDWQRLCGYVQPTAFTLHCTIVSLAMNTLRNTAYNIIVVL